MKEAYMKRRFSTKAHSHFAEIRETKHGNPYVVFVQGTKRNAKWSNQHIVIFQDEMNGLISFLEQFRVGMKNRKYKTEQKNIIDRMEEIEAQYLEEMDDEIDYDGIIDVIQDIQDDLDDYAASDKDGWFYRD